MISLPFEFTSAGGHLKTVAVAVVFNMLGPVTTATPSATRSECVRYDSTTNAGSPLTKPRSAATGTAIAELRRISGLTWEQLAGLLQVSRRALHFWATDKQMHPTNEHRLHRLLAALRRLDRGSPAQNRALLFSPLDDGVMPYDLLREAEYEEAVARLGEGQTPPRPGPLPLSAAERARRRPPAPADLLDVRQDNIPLPAGRVIRIKPIRRTPKV